MKRGLIGIGLGLLAILGIPSAGFAAGEIITDDIPRFWQAWDKSGVNFEPTVFATEYLENGTPGLKDFIRGRIDSAENLSATIKSSPNYYASLRVRSAELEAMKPEIQRILDQYSSWYPTAKLPDIYIVIGAMNSGGTASRNGLIIGLDMYGLTENLPIAELSEWHRQVLKPVSHIPAIVAHEMVHFQQAEFDDRSLLAQALREGIADFIGEQLSGKTINEHLKAYAEPRERQLWQDFQLVMAGDNYQGWLYGGTATKERPADLGYWMGYRIARSYYLNHGASQDAISDMLQMTDAKAFLQKSRYNSGNTFGTPATRN